MLDCDGSAGKLFIRKPDRHPDCKPDRHPDCVGDVDAFTDCHDDGDGHADADSRVVRTPIFVEPDPITYTDNLRNAKPRLHLPDYNPERLCDSLRNDESVSNPVDVKDAKPKSYDHLIAVSECLRDNVRHGEPISNPVVV